jgi:hypothetical protein
VSFIFLGIGQGIGHGPLGRFAQHEARARLVEAQRAAALGLVLGGLLFEGLGEVLSGLFHRAAG